MKRVEKITGQGYEARIANQAVHQAKINELVDIVNRLLLISEGGIIHEMSIPCTHCNKLVSLTLDQMAVARKVVDGYDETRGDDR